MMKPLLTLCVALCWSLLSQGQQWDFQLPRPSGANCIKVLFSNEENGYVLNESGNFIVTRDAGVSWAISRTFPDASYMAMADSTFVIPTRVSGKVYISKDLGKTWEVSMPGPDSLAFYRAEVVSRDTFFVSTRKGKLYRTVDGGSTWQLTEVGHWIEEMDFVNSKTGFIGTLSEVVLKTDDGGATWQESLRIPAEFSEVKALYFRDLNNGFAFRADDKLYRTQDGGKTWTSTVINLDVFSIYFVDDKVGYLAGLIGSIYKTTDGGATWALLRTSEPNGFEDFRSVFFTSQQVGFAVAQNGRIAKSTDGGLTWKHYDPNLYYRIEHISFPARDTGYAVQGYDLVKTADGGKNWVLLNTPLTAEGNGYWFRFCHFFSATEGIVPTGSDLGPAYVYKTLDGGVTWTRTTPFDGKGVHATSMSFAGRNGYLILDSLVPGRQPTYKKKMVRTLNGGASWEIMEYNTSFQRLYFIKPGVGYGIAGTKLFKTVDSARTWVELSIDGNSRYLNSVYFINEQYGFLTADFSPLRRTVDSGKTWVVVKDQILPYDFGEVRFLNDRVGLVTRENGEMFSTADSGTTWRQLESLPILGTTGLETGKDSSIYVYGNTMIARISLQDLWQYDIATDASSCGANITGVMESVMGKAGHIRFEYGLADFASGLDLPVPGLDQAAAPFSVDLDHLEPNRLYQWRLVYEMDGRQRYGAVHYFWTKRRPQQLTVTANAAASICQGDNLGLTSSSAQNIQWYRDGVAIDSLKGRPQIVVDKAGSYAAGVDDGCYSLMSAPVVVVVKEVPVKPVITAAGKVLSSSAATGNQWYFNGTAIAGAVNQQLTVNEPGNYTVRATVNGCTSALSDAFNFIMTGIVDPNSWNGEVGIYPNPVGASVNIMNRNSRRLTVVVSDMSGKVLIQQAVHNTYQAINAGGLGKGVYRVAITDTVRHETIHVLILKI